MRKQINPINVEELLGTEDFLFEVADQYIMVYEFPQLQLYTWM